MQWIVWGAAFFLCWFLLFCLINAFGLSKESGGTAPPSTPRDPRAPEGMTETEYNGWLDRRRLADSYIAEANRKISERSG